MHSAIAIATLSIRLVKLLFKVSTMYTYALPIRTYEKRGKKKIITRFFFYQFLNAFLYMIFERGLKT